MRRTNSCSLVVLTVELVGLMDTGKRDANLQTKTKRCVRGPKGGSRDDETNEVEGRARKAYVDTSKL